jgi:hypothetical protein
MARQCRFFSCYHDIILIFLLKTLSSPLNYFPYQRIHNNVKSLFLYMLGYVFNVGLSQVINNLSIAIFPLQIETSEKKSEQKMGV